MMYSAQLIRTEHANTIRTVLIDRGDTVGIAHEIAKRMGEGPDYAESLIENLRYPEPAVEYIDVKDDADGSWLIRIAKIDG